MSFEESNPYEPPQADIRGYRDESKVIRLNYADFTLRVIACLIDIFGLFLLWLVVGGVLAFLFGTIYQDSGDLVLDGPIFRVAVGIWFVYTLVYFVGLESSRFQATLGKMAVGIKVTDLKGGRITVLYAVGRFFTKIGLTAICFATVVGLIFMFTPAFSKRKQALHDMVVGTLVVKSR